MKKVFLTGYEDHTIDSFVQKLLDAQIETLIDVRELPLSRKKGFSKNSLKSALESKGIKYCHFKSLGSPRAVRHQLREEGDYVRFFKQYRAHLKSEKESLEDLHNVIRKTKHSALMCFEENCELCHRSILASELLKRNPRLKVIPI